VIVGGEGRDGDDEQQQGRDATEHGFGRLGILPK
jgi:hypothetical protein